MIRAKARGGASARAGTGVKGEGREEGRGERGEGRRGRTGVEGTGVVVVTGRSLLSLHEPLGVPLSPCTRGRVRSSVSSLKPALNHGVGLRRFVWFAWFAWHGAV
jgi:hypothetical protein